MTTSIMDFKQWRKERGLSRVKAGAIFGHGNSDYFKRLESDEANVIKKKAVLAALSLYEDKDKWREVENTASKLDKPMIQQFVDYCMKKGMSKTEIGNICGFASNGIMKKYSDGSRDINIARSSNKILIASQMILTGFINPESQTSVVPVIAETVVDNNAFEKIEPKIINGEPWWVVADICRAIGYVNPSHAIRLARKNDLQKCRGSSSTGQIVEQWIVNEKGLARILAKANTPKCEPFESWVFDEVLPSIRKSGSYSMAPAQPITQHPDVRLFMESISQIANMIGFSDQKQTREIMRVEQKVESVKSDIDSLKETAAKAAHDELKSNMMKIEARKARLHELKNCIVRRAHELPETDTEAAFYKVHANVWRTIHRAAVPPVANLNGYRDLSQIEHAVAGAEMILLRLGGKIPPEQTELF